MTMDITTLNKVREAAGLLSIEDVIALSSRNTIFDPFSVLIAHGIEIGVGNVIYPVVSLLREGAARLEIGDGNVFHPGTVIAATSGDILVADKNQFGEGGFTAKANRSGARITIGSHGRYLGGAAVYGTSKLEDGSQILGAILVDSSHLEGGAAFNTADPDLRGGVLKGQGTARDLIVPQGYVISAQGSFDAAAMKSQTFYHPTAK
ncbi:hypothetical protein [Roseinatronobacter alkalisoli]|uniref:AraC family transcriptional regulator n=1 Tax=Roseinatronobacter alkalisoli TaxID=3028235 RepID=A0ABT5TA29_9RHOB|nr:hypothetical protein [Roseinatronobacter sp. HJB301]MDD7971966.1 hypothetical protein [Roseinatronobacter sp. HJB301]